MIDAPEGRYVATSDIPGSFLQKDYKKRCIHINMERVMLSLLDYIGPDYYNNFIYLDSHGRKCMYEEPKNSIYRHVEVSPLFCKNSKSLGKRVTRETNMIGV